MNTLGKRKKEVSTWLSKRLFLLVEAFRIKDNKYINLSVAVLVILFYQNTYGNLEGRDCRSRQITPKPNSSSRPVCIPSDPYALDLSYTIAGFRKGDLDCECQNKIDHAKRSGFTSITLTPTFKFDTKTNKISADTAWPGEIKSCLERIWMSGLNVVFKPHIDSSATLNSSRGTEEEWRARFDVGPESNYEILFKEFFEWSDVHKRELNGALQKVTVIAATELETAIANHPSYWAQFLQNLKRKLATQGAANVRVGWAPNWIYGLNFPKKSFTGNTCKAFRDFTENADFIAPSFYGDWSQIDLRELQAYSREAEVRENLGNADNINVKTKIVLNELKSINNFKNILDPNSFYWSKRVLFGCTNKSFLDKPLAVGEFSIGNNLESAELDTRIELESRDANAKEKRRYAYENLLFWAATRYTQRADQSNSVSRGLPLSIWSVGPEFDPTQDQEIVRLFKSYTDNRCRPKPIDSPKINIAVPSTTK